MRRKADGAGAPAPDWVCCLRGKVGDDVARRSVEGRPIPWETPKSRGSTQESLWGVAPPLRGAAGIPPVWAGGQPCHRLLSAPDSPPTGWYAPEIASQPLFQPQVTALATAIETLLSLKCTPLLRLFSHSHMCLKPARPPLTVHL